MRPPESHQICILSPELPSLLDDSDLLLGQAIEFVDERVHLLLPLRYLLLEEFWYVSLKLLELPNTLEVQCPD